MIKFLKGIVFSSLSVIPAYLAVVLLSGELDDPAILAWMLMVYAVTLAGILFVGIPVHLILSALKIKQFLYYGLIGFVIPAIFVLWTTPFGKDGFYAILLQSLTLGGAGALVAFVFWKTAVAGNR